MAWKCCICRQLQRGIYGWASEMTFLIPLLALIAGVVTGDFFENPLWGLLPVGCGLGIYLLLLNISKSPYAARKFNPLHYVWIFFIFFGIGLVASWFHHPMELSEKERSRFVVAQGEIIEAHPYSQGDRFLVDIQFLADKSGNTLDCRNLGTEISTDGYSGNPGDIIIFPVNLSPIEDNKNFRSSGQSEIKKRKGILYGSYVKSDFIKYKSFHKDLKTVSVAWRDKIEMEIEKSSLKKETSDFLISILLGDRSFMQDNAKTTFSNAGVSHILALSGMHVAIICGLIMFLLFPLKIARYNKTRYWLAVIILWGYAFFSGLAPSTVRACIMTTFVVIAMSVERRNASSNSLLASAFIIILFDPTAIYDVGLQLSFMSVACILAFAGPLNTVSHHYHPKLHSVTSAILVSLSASLGTWVLVSYYFKRIPLLFLPANLLLLPCLPPFIGLSIFYVAMLFFGADLKIIAWVLDNVYSFFLRFSDWLTDYGNATIDYQASLPIVLLWVTGLLVIGFALKRKKNMTAVICASSLFVLTVVAVPFLNTEQPPSVIFQKNYYEISVAHYDSNDVEVKMFPRNTVSRIVKKGHEIISVDSPSALDSLASMISTRKKGKKKYLIISSGFRGKKLRDVPGIEGFDKIILHSSIKPKNESLLKKEALELGLKQIHSLRDEGPLEVGV